MPRIVMQFYDNKIEKPATENCRSVAIVKFKSSQSSQTGMFTLEVDKHCCSY